MIRLIEQHQQFVKDVKAQKPIDIQSIPELPGDPPIPKTLLYNYRMLTWRLEC